MISFLPLIIVLVLQFILQFVLYNVLHLSFIWVEIIINIVLSLVYSLFVFRGREKWTNPEFHKTIAIYFAIFTALSFLMYYL